uniref:uncharacterized protein LOC122608619 n=1 Tax=Erigeron canadensis TaxID=72917 RepID=UPI001CB98D3B|nr:uncharacterized protein LOC122608619 [Erigeron canadensis]
MSSEDELWVPILIKNAYSLPCPLPQWPSSPQGGFATGIINIGELEIAMVKKFEYISCYFPPATSFLPSLSSGGGFCFFKPVSIPDGFCVLGHSSMPRVNQQLKSGYSIVVRDARTKTNVNTNTNSPPPLKFPITYMLKFLDHLLYVRVPLPPEGYQAMGYVVTTSCVGPELDEVVCVRDDLVFRYETGKNDPNPFFKTVVVGVSHHFKVRDPDDRDPEVYVCCLRNLNPNLEAMPNLEQLEALIDHYGPTVYYHPDEVYLPSSVTWLQQTSTNV